MFKNDESMFKFLNDGVRLEAYEQFFVGKWLDNHGEKMYLATAYLFQEAVSLLFLVESQNTQAGSHLLSPEMTHEEIYLRSFASKGDILDFQTKINGHISRQSNYRKYSSSKNPFAAYIAENLTRQNLIPSDFDNKELTFCKIDLEFEEKIDCIHKIDLKERAYINKDHLVQKNFYLELWKTRPMY